MAIPFIDFRPAQVMRNKEVYVCYYVLDPTNDRLKRMRIRCNRIKNRREQLKYAVLLCSEINRKLYNGWNPLTGEDTAAKRRVSIVEAATDHVRRKAKDLRKDTVRTPPRYRALQTYGLCGCPLPGLTLPVQSPPSAVASASLHPCESVIPPAPTEAGGTLDGTSISLRIATKKYYFCTVEQSRMTHDRTYRPVRRVPASRLRDMDGSMRQAPRRSAGHAATHPVQPLKGLPGTRATDVSYRALAPGGAGFCYRICTGTSESRPTAHYSLPTAHWTYTFSAKEKDPETGLSYFGSRYYSSDLSVWLSVDPMSDKYPGLSPYVYCADNPVRCVDPNGEEIGIPPYIKDAIANAITSTAENAHNLYLKASSMVQDHPWMVNAANLMVLAATTAVSKITDMNPKTMSWLEKHLLNFTVTNTSGWESATRLRKDNDGNGQHDGIIPNKKRGDGIKLGGNLQEVWQWTEVY